MLDEVHSGSSDMELILARVLPKLKNVTNFKVVLLSATLNMAEFLQRAQDAGLESRYIKTRIAKVGIKNWLTCVYLLTHQC